MKAVGKFLRIIIQLQALFGRLVQELKGRAGRLRPVEGQESADAETGGAPGGVAEGAHFPVRVDGPPARGRAGGNGAG